MGNAESSGTAPEILNGQPFTEKSDIYALEVFLYQILVGDFHKVMSPERPRDIDDELLCEDIALVVERNPAMRLSVIPPSDGFTASLQQPSRFPKRKWAFHTCERSSWRPWRRDGVHARPPWQNFQAFFVAS
jgi:hypothetical protein